MILPLYVRALSGCEGKHHEATRLAAVQREGRAWLHPMLDVCLIFSAGGALTRLGAAVVAPAVSK